MVVLEGVVLEHAQHVDVVSPRGVRVIELLCFLGVLQYKISEKVKKNWRRGEARAGEGRGKKERFKIYKKTNRKKKDTLTSTEQWSSSMN